MKYDNLRTAIADIGLTHNELASILGISWSGLQHRIKADRLDLHLCLRGIECIKGNAKTDKWKLKLGVESGLGNKL